MERGLHIALAGLLVIGWTAVVRAQAQEWVTIKEPPDQCWQDVKQVTKARDIDDAAHSFTAMWWNPPGEVAFRAQVLSEHEWNARKKHPRSGVCIVTVTMTTLQGRTLPLYGPRPGSPEYIIAHSIKDGVDRLIEERKKAKHP